MTPLDLTAGPPSNPRLAFAGVIFLQRTIDKIRATLPGGNLGEYTLEGLTTMQCEQLGIPLADLIAVVRDARSDDDVREYIERTVPADKREAWNAFLRARKPGGGDPEIALRIYPWLGERPDLVLTLDILPEDDRRTFFSD